MQRAVFGIVEERSDRYAILRLQEKVGECVVDKHRPRGTSIDYAKILDNSVWVYFQTVLSKQAMLEIDPLGVYRS